MDKSVFVNTLIQKKLILPPLTGYTDYPYRQILSEFNPPFMTTEMVNARAVIHKNKQTLKMLDKVKGNHFSGAQLIGKNPEIMKKAAMIIEELGFDYIDINMGCTVKKVITKGEGVSLMKNEDLAFEIIQNISNNVDIPVTVKIRSGYSIKNRNAVSLSKKLEKAGACAITVHGRSGEKKFCLNIDYDIIRQTSDAISIPVIANGGIFSADDLKNIIEKTNVSAVMPGRGIIGNPWIIPEILYYFSNRSYNKPDFEERKSLCIKHVKNSCNYYGDRNGIFKMRKIVHRYFPDTKNLKYLKNDMQKVTTLKDIKLIIDKIKYVNLSYIYS